MTVRCIDCQHFDLKGSPIGKLGFGLCAWQKSKARMFSAVHPQDCARFEAGRAATVALREQLMRKHGVLTDLPKEPA